MHRPQAEDVDTRPINPRNGFGWLNDHPLSRNIYAPGEILPGTETMTQWSPYGTFNAAPYYGGHDALSPGRHSIMAVPQADMYDMSPNPWPNNGQFDHPNFYPGLLRLTRRESSAHAGFTQPTYPGPVMLFHAPPVFSVQTTPIVAVGI